MTAPVLTSELVRPEKQVADRPTAQVVLAALGEMVGAIVAQVAALAEAAQVGQAAVRGVVVEMGGGEDDTGAPQRCLGRRLRAGPAAAVAPDRAVLPPSVSHAGDGLAVGAAACLTAPAGTAEADQATDLRPVDRVEPAQGGADGHGRIVLHLGG